MAFSIGTLERTSPHLMADLVELIVALNLDGRAEYQLDDVASLIEGQPGFDDSETRTLRDSLVDAWIHLGYRVERFDADYPFILRGGGLRLKSRLTSGARIYRLLLASSRLRSFDRTLRSAWAATFALLSREALAQLMPETAKVRIFDVNSSDRKSYFGTDCRKALRVLGKDLAARTDEVECDSHGASGDAGIDLVGVVAWNDQAPGIHAILGQCAARETEWPQKRLEAHPIALRAYFWFLVEPVNAFFIPVLYRETTGSWITHTPASGCVLIDRLRAILLLRQQNVKSGIVSKHWFQKFERQFDGVGRALHAAVA